MAAVLLAEVLPAPATASVPTPADAKTRVGGFDLEIAAGVGAERAISETGIGRGEAGRSSYGLLQPERRLRRQKRKNRRHRPGFRPDICCLEGPVGLTLALGRQAGIDIREVGGLQLVAFADAWTFLDACVDAGVLVLGIEGFRLDSGQVRPDMGARQPGSAPRTPE